MNDKRSEQSQNISHASFQDRYKLIFNSTVDVIVDIDKNGTIVDVNKRATQISGYKRKDLVGKKISALSNIFTTKSLALIVANFAKRMLGAPVKPYEVEAKSKSGERLFFEVNAVSLKDENGKKIGELAILHDITEREQMGETLSEEKKMLEATIENMVDAVFLIDKKRKITKWNKQAYEMTGYSEKEVLGKDCADILKITDEKGVNICRKKCPMKQVFETKKPIIRGPYAEHTYYFTTREGKKIPASAAVAPLLDKNGDIIGGIKSFSDITQEKAIDEAKSEFVSLASHQLRTPLSTISWYSEMLLACDVGDLSKKQRQYLSEIYQANQRMAKLVNDLLNVSRIEMGIFMVEVRSVDIRKVADTVLGELLPKIRRKELNIIKKYDEKLPKVNLDKNLMTIILQNLISNAVKYTEKNGRVEIEVLAKEKNIFIRVTDTGIGIPKDQQSKVFSKMFRADNVKEIESDGTGLGLYIVKSIIDKTGGKIRFKSKENKGTTFYVTIPKKGMKRRAGTKQLISSK